MQAEERSWPTRSPGHVAYAAACASAGWSAARASSRWRASQAWHRAGHHPFAGVETHQAALDWDAVRSQKDALVSDLRQAKYADVMAAYPEVTFIPGRAQFQPDGSV